MTPDALLLLGLADWPRLRPRLLQSVFHRVHRGVHLGKLPDRGVSFVLAFRSLSGLSTWGEGLSPSSESQT